MHFMKVIHYIAGLDKTSGGITEYLRLLASELVKEIDVVVATSVSENPIQIRGVKIHFFRYHPLYINTLIREFTQFIKSEQPDIVHINGIWNIQNWAFHQAAYKLETPIILSPHGMLEPWIMEHNRWKKRLAMWLYQRKSIRNASLLHVTSSMEKQSVQRLGFYNSLEVIPNGIDLAETKTGKKKYGSKKILFISRFHPKKGIELLLEAWRGLDNLGWKLELVGEGDPSYVNALKKGVRNLKNVHFIGFKYGKAKWECFNSADVMVLPTHSENFGIVVTEALSVGVPVLTTKGTPWRDLETHNCGWWINLSVKELQIALKNIFNTPTSELKAMGERGRSLVLRKYKIEKIAQSFIGLYNSQIKAKG